MDVKKDHEFEGFLSELSIYGKVSVKKSDSYCGLFISVFGFIYLPLVCLNILIFDQ